MALQSTRVPHSEGEPSRLSSHVRAAQRGSTQEQGYEDESERVEMVSGEARLNPPRR